MSARKIVLDCDPGHDDAIAIMLACASPEIELLGVTTVAGNVTLEHTTRNALRVLDLLGRADIPVAAGRDGPLIRKLSTALRSPARGLPRAGDFAGGMQFFVERLVRYQA